jgi:hypothetical protein
VAPAAPRQYRKQSFIAPCTYLVGVALTLGSQMHIDDALFDRKTGKLVVRGRIETSEPWEEQPAFADHDHLLVDPTPFGTQCRAVTKLEPCGGGLCDATPSPVSIYLRLLTSELFGGMNIAAPSLPHAYLQFGGWDCGTLTGLRPKKSPVSADTHGEPGPASMVSRKSLLVSVDLIKEPGPQGMAFKIAGGLAPPPDPASDEPPTGKGRYSIDGVVPWATMRVRGLEVGARYQLFVPRGDKPGDALGAVPRNVTAVRDLRIAGAEQCVVAGRLEVASETRTQRASEGFLAMRLSRLYGGGMSVTDCDLAKLRSDGFVDTLGSKLTFGFDLIDDAVIARFLQRDARVQVTMTGDGLGALHYDSGLGDSPADPLGRIRQRLRTLDFFAALNPLGLALRLSGTLERIDADFMEKVRPRLDALGPLFQHKWASDPWTRFQVEALVPWLWLVVRGNPLARRQSEFAASAEPQPKGSDE